MVANNKGTAPSRKAFPEMFTAFGTFARAHRDAILYVHSDQFGFRDGLDLQTLAELADIPEGQIRFADPYELIVGTPAATMAALYSSRWTCWRRRRSAKGSGSPSSKPKRAARPSS
jgi:hypothetical protein